MIIKEKGRITLASIFMILAIGLTVYFLNLVTNPETIQEATTILALLTAVVALIISLLNTVKLRKTWKK